MTSWHAERSWRAVLQFPHRRPCPFSLSPSSHRPPTPLAPPSTPRFAFSPLYISEVQTLLSQYVFWCSITARSGEQDRRGDPPHSCVFSALYIMAMAMAGYAEQLP